ncbi:hypothetical protein F5Y06DRAFT_291173 [Hypoxylon sp. FL0890]|nr:hypothetical protein F5Y06DRAFT_291173 [Hypoxylon sp. FL0890]
MLEVLEPGVCFDYWVLALPRRHHLMDNVTLYTEQWFIMGPLWLVYFAALLIIITIIANLFIRPTWYDEESPEEHCHILDTHEKMVWEYGRQIEGLNVIGGELRVKLRAQGIFLAAGGP